VPVTPPRTSDSYVDRRINLYDWRGSGHEKGLFKPESVPEEAVIGVIDHFGTARD
jgi:hypothetical protein